MPVHTPVVTVATLNGSTVFTVPGPSPELRVCHDRGPDLPHPRDCVSVTVAHGITSVIISWWAYCSSTPALGYPLFPSTDTRVVA